MGYGPQGHKESETTERLHFASLHFILFSIEAAAIDFGSWVKVLTQIPLQLTPTAVQSCHFPAIILVSPSTKVRLYLRKLTPFSEIWEGVGFEVLEHLHDRV